MPAGISAARGRVRIRDAGGVSVGASSADSAASVASVSRGREPSAAEDRERSTRRLEGAKKGVRLANGKMRRFAGHDARSPSTRDVP